MMNPKYQFKQDKHLYKYYAGYSNEFVQSIFEHFSVNSKSVLDPWNGSGTTTTVAAQFGIEEILGFDVNPAMAIVSSADLLMKEELKLFSIEEKEFLNIEQIKQDPLSDWFTKESVLSIRNFELSLRNNFIPLEELRDNKYTVFEKDIFQEVLSSRLCSFYYLILFETLKGFLNGFKSSNPTWIKVAKDPNEKIAISFESIVEAFIQNLQSKKVVIDNKPDFISRDAVISVGDSRNLPLDNSSIDLVVTSPPYCTRIDYAVATRIELAVLGMGNNLSFEKLRKNMIGTTKITGDSLDKVSKSTTAISFLNAVSEHTSKASKSYYYKQFDQYFFGIEQSLTEIDRVMSDDGSVVIVVQDSYYKDLYLDIADIFSEIMMSLGWNLIHNEPFEKRLTMASVNQRSKRYRDNSVATESVLIFERER